MNRQLLKPLMMCNGPLTESMNPGCKPENLNCKTHNGILILVLKAVLHPLRLLQVKVEWSRLQCPVHYYTTTSKIYGAYESPEGSQFYGHKIKLIYHLPYGHISKVNIEKAG